MVHTDPFKGESSVEVIPFKFLPQQSRIKEIYAEEFDLIFTCGGGDIATGRSQHERASRRLAVWLN